MTDGEAGTISGRQLLIGIPLFVGLGLGALLLGMRVLDEGSVARVVVDAVGLSLLTAGVFGLLLGPLVQNLMALGERRQRKLQAETRELFKEAEALGTRLEKFTKDAESELISAQVSEILAITRRLQHSDLKRGTREMDDRLQAARDSLTLPESPSGVVGDAEEHTEGGRPL